MLSIKKLIILGIVFIDMAVNQTVLAETVSIKAANLAGAQSLLAPDFLIRVYEGEKDGKCHSPTEFPFGQDWKVIPADMAYPPEKFQTLVQYESVTLTRTKNQDSSEPFKVCLAQFYQMGGGETYNIPVEVKNGDRLTLRVISNNFYYFKNGQQLN